jgi:hypothetical protein
LINDPASAEIEMAHGNPTSSPLALSIAPG